MKTTDVQLRRYIAEGRPICGVCAGENGAAWPKRHVATFWMGECILCGQERAVCCTSDYDWPHITGPKASREY